MNSWSHQNFTHGDNDMNKNESTMLGNLGRMAGYFDAMGISPLGVVLIVLGAIGGYAICDAEISRYGKDFPLLGSGLASAGAMIAGAILQPAKKSR